MNRIFFIFIKYNRLIPTVHPVPTPLSTNELDNNKINEGGSNQKLMLFSRGNAISLQIIINKSFTFVFIIFQ